MKQIPDKSVDMILCDLPYGTTSCKWDSIIPMNDYVEVYKKNKLVKMNLDEWILYNFYNSHNINIDYIKDEFENNKKLGLWSHYDRIIKDDGVVCLFGNEPFSSKLRLSNIENYKYDIYWEKERLTNINQVKRRVGKTVETISVFYKKQCTYNPQMTKYEGKPRSNKVRNGILGKLTDEQEKKVIEYKDTGYRYPTQVWKYQRDCLISNLHPTQKPISLLENLIKTYSNKNDIVLDNCMGSGSTGVACINTNRRFIGIELEKKYFEIAKERIDKLIVSCLTPKGKGL